MRFSAHASWITRGIALLGLLCLGCGGPAPLTVDMPLHLEDHLDAATIVGSEVPADVPAVMEWHFDEPQEDWKPLPWNEVTQLDDALRVTMTGSTRSPNGRPWLGGLVLEVPDWNYEDLAHLVVRARTSDDFRDFGTAFNRREGTGTRGPLDGGLPDRRGPFEYLGDRTAVVSDGTVQTYRLRLDFFWGFSPEEPIRQIF